jgi:hypothetical protein
VQIVGGMTLKRSSIDGCLRMSWSESGRGPQDLDPGGRMRDHIDDQLPVGGRARSSATHPDVDPSKSPMYRGCCNFGWGLGKVLRSAIDGEPSTRLSRCEVVGV